MPGLLYHYTSLGTLFAILDNLVHCPISGKVDSDSLDYYHFNLWASHSAYMNDPTENNWFNQCRKEAFETYQHEKELPSKSFQYDWLCQAFYQIDTDQRFIISFSEREDTLSMWRGYGEDGRGIAIGFSFDELISLRSPEMCLLSCRYFSKDNFIKDYSEETLQKIYNALPVTPTIDEPLKLQIPEAFRADYGNNLILKNSKYEEEREWRVISLQDDYTNLKYRLQNGLIVPYIELEFPLSFIKRIVIGPSAQKEYMAFSLKMILKSKLGWLSKEIEIEESTIPYKNNR